jgi:predicted DNA repair protein MutK
MPSGLLALLDDISALTKAIALSIDDVPSHVGKTTGKVSGIVIDDAAVTPKYVVGLDPSRELSVIYKIAKRSLVNKLLILSPLALVLGYFAHWAIAPILMLGGAYLCYEGYEKVHSMFGHNHDKGHANDEVIPMSLEELEKERVAGAIRTDLILSAEIIAIAYYQVSEEALVNQALVLIAVSLFITLIVYGFVGFLVKLDDIGLKMTKRKNSSIRKMGIGIVKFMPTSLKILSYLGTAAMLWVGAEIIAHGIPFIKLLLHDVEHYLEVLPVIGSLALILFFALTGIMIGFLVERMVAVFKSVFVRKKI